MLVHKHMSYIERLRFAARIVAREVVADVRARENLVGWDFETTNRINDVYERAFEAAMCTLVIPKRAC